MCTHVCIGCFFLKLTERLGPTLQRERHTEIELLYFNSFKWPYFQDRIIMAVLIVLFGKRSENSRLDHSRGEASPSSPPARRHWLHNEWRFGVDGDDMPRR